MTSLSKNMVDGLDIKSNYRRSWSRKCDHSPPETNIYIYYTESGKTPMHDRFIVTESGGLSLGTSLNGYGSKDSTIKVLGMDEKQKVEKEIINNLISSPPLQFENQRLYCKTFSLD